ncbi:TRAP transporter substrate-binding protein [Chachezhania sediminis]|uniref:TRAP transporter substrate-binding protein n=1 Tax=Chachezhania sediminis TaxID=2599291 RepID=UPI00131E800F|nr:TRAP transporter substrate-binding protein [Chachezhania sediminis]
MNFARTCALSLVLGAASTAAGADTTLRYSNWLPATHGFMANVIEPWIADVERVTDGRVKVDILPKVVGTVPTQFEVVRDGLADVSLIVDGYSPGRFNVNGIVELPFLGNNAEAITIAYWRIYKKYLEPFAEYENAIPFGKASVGAMALATGSDKVDTLDGFRGLKLRVPTPTTSKMVAELGGAPVNKPVSEMYELISTGVVDGMISSTETIKTFKVAPSIKHVLTVPGGLGSTGISFIVNQEALDELSPADREAFWSVSGEVFSKRIGEVYVRLNAEGVAAVLENGGQINEASAGLTAELHEKLKPIEAAWIADAEQRGLKNAADVLAEFRAEIAKLEAELGDN